MLTDTVCAAASAAGLAVAFLTAYRKRFLAATRIAAYALLPVGLALTGILGWIADLVFKPSVWLGFGVLGLSWLLFLVVRAVEHRGDGTRKERRAAAERGGAQAPAPVAGGRPRGIKGAAKSGGSSGTEDFSDIEAILKKHGI
ncbi:hypothetical protein [Streptomyces sp. NPDC097640]|uniref:hypothetical protein n=1 Tax=Streptomyces sp. NPDC097640 TaxID=3157229 RepID=UPI0033319812